MKIKLVLVTCACERDGSMDVCVFAYVGEGDKNSEN